MKQKPIEAKDLHIGCMNCSTATLKAPLTMTIAVGFGDARITFNDKTVYDGESDYQNGKKPKTLRTFELQARKKKGDWRFIHYGPMHGETFQRQGKNNWVCIESNRGFA